MGVSALRAHHPSKPRVSDGPAGPGFSVTGRARHRLLTPCPASAARPHPTRSGSLAKSCPAQALEGGVPSGPCGSWRRMGTPRTPQHSGLGSQGVAYSGLSQRWGPSPCSPGAPDAGPRAGTPSPKGQACLRGQGGLCVPFALCPLSHPADGVTGLTLNAMCPGVRLSVGQAARVSLPLDTVPPAPPRGQNAPIVLENGVPKP